MKEREKNLKSKNTAKKHKHHKRIISKKNCKNSPTFKSKEILAKIRPKSYFI
jgi:hypothetical protein